MTDFAYVNARICSMRAELLARPDVEKILELDSAEMVAERLLKSPYQAELAACVRNQTALAALDEAFDLHLAARFTKIVGLIDPTEEEWLYLLTETWDVQCIKTILRGITTETPPADMLSMLGPGARLTKNELKRLTEAPDVKTIADQLMSWSMPLGNVVKAGLAEFRTDHNLAPIEFALDMHRFMRGREMVEESFLADSTAAALLFAEADLQNIIVCLVHIDSDDKPRLFPSSKESESAIRALAQAKDIGQAIDVLANSNFKTIIDKALPFMAQPGRFAMFERLLYSELLRQSGTMAMRDPLSIAVPCHYLRCKYNEVMNLRLIAHGLEGGMPRNAIRTGMIFYGLSDS